MAVVSPPFTAVCQQVIWSACRGIIWLMTVEFPYLITNRISAPLELCGEESDEWQGSTQWPKRYRGPKMEKWVRQSKKRDKAERCLTFLPTSFLQVWETLCFPSAADKSNSFSWNWQVFVSGQLTIFSPPVMKVVAGVNALGGNGGLFIPLKAQRHTCFAWSVICNCGISWEAQEQSTLCFERAPSAN